ncbi:unnamed protein product [Thlaspi arvense]|uniref:DUF668 domain-containing protein n=1 Tax=Thlaspi arvense TaxID=13288 RepID=A0AAU9TAB6_THLAR|nr:unnamed protein product [Thlaspi arvense]
MFIFSLSSGNNISSLRTELKSQRKLVKNLKKKSLWSRSLEEDPAVWDMKVHEIISGLDVGFGHRCGVGLMNVINSRTWGHGFRVMEKLVDVVLFLNWEICNAFSMADSEAPLEGSQSNQQKLGPAGLALHYANIVIQIDTLTRLA